MVSNDNVKESGPIVIPGEPMNSVFYDPPGFSEDVLEELCSRWDIRRIFSDGGRDGSIGGGAELVVEFGDSVRRSYFDLFAIEEELASRLGVAFKVFTLGAITNSEYESTRRQESEFRVVHAAD